MACSRRQKLSLKILFPPQSTSWHAYIPCKVSVISDKNFFKYSHSSAFSVPVWLRRERSRLWTPSSTLNHCYTGIIKVVPTVFCNMIVSCIDYAAAAKKLYFKHFFYFLHFLYQHTPQNVEKNHHFCTFKRHLQPSDIMENHFSYPAILSQHRCPWCHVCFWVCIFSAVQKHTQIPQNHQHNEADFWRDAAEDGTTEWEPPDLHPKCSSEHFTGQEGVQKTVHHVTVAVLSFAKWS